MTKLLDLLEVYLRWRQLPEVPYRTVPYRLPPAWVAVRSAPLAGTGPFPPEQHALTVLPATACCCLQHLGGGTMQYLRIDGSTALEDRCGRATAHIPAPAPRPAACSPRLLPLTCHSHPLRATPAPAPLHTTSHPLPPRTRPLPALPCASPPRRESAIQQFNAKDSPAFIFLLSIRAAGRGLNLQSSDTVVIYDPDPNPKNEEQAIAR